VFWDTASLKNMAEVFRESLTPFMIPSLEQRVFSSRTRHCLSNFTRICNSWTNTLRNDQRTPSIPEQSRKDTTLLYKHIKVLSKSHILESLCFFSKLCQDRMAKAFIYHSFKKCFRGAYLYPAWDKIILSCIHHWFNFT
jgi:hypothetical protein